MKTHTVLKSTLFLCALILLPTQIQAFDVTDKSITRLSDTVTMYTLEYELGFLNADMWVPIAASKTLKEGNKTASLVLSTAPIQGKQYFVPMKSRASFTLLVLEQHEVGKSKGSITVEELPLILREKGKEKEVHIFGKDHLKDFTTKK